MTTPSIQFRCPNCGKEELHIDFGVHYHQCGGGIQTKKARDFGSKGKTRTVKRDVGTRMVRVHPAKP